MSRFSLFGVPDHALLQTLRSLVAQDRVTTADLLAHIAEVDERKLYLPAAYPSMHAYCVRTLGFSEDAAFKRITAARIARAFPAIFPAVADGRLHLAAVLLIAPQLTSGNADEWIAAAAGKSKSEIALLLAERAPKPDVPAFVAPIASASPTKQLAPGRVQDSSCQLAPGRVSGDAPLEGRAANDSSLAARPLAASPVVAAPARLESAPPPARVAPLAPQRFAMQLTIGQTTHDKLRRAQNLLGHALPTNDHEALLERALDALIAALEKRRFAATTRPAKRTSRGEGRYVPAEVRRAVWARDGGRCTFTSADGRRCDARTRLEFDHAHPLARGGRATVANTRLRCRAHNPYDAEVAFGREYVRRRREGARDAGESVSAP